MQKKEETLNRLSEEEVILDLKKQGLPYFGTKNERLDRLKNHYGIISTNLQSKANVLCEIDRIKQQEGIVLGVFHEQHAQGLHHARSL